MVFSWLECVGHQAVLSRQGLCVCSRRGEEAAVVRGVVGLCR